MLDGVSAYRKAANHAEAALTDIEVEKFLQKRLKARQSQIAGTHGVQRDAALCKLTDGGVDLFDVMRLEHSDPVSGAAKGLCSPTAFIIQRGEAARLTGRRG